ncbi:MAG: hypothetical protein IKT44_00040, partial [Clostridia bacterium]|nr:hypothetical protein [Clostridia bacterium]
MWVQSTYLTKNKEDVTQTASADNGQDTDAQSASASPSSNNTVPRNTGIVNNNISQNGGDNTENSELQSTAEGNELDIETMSFEEDGAEDTAEELSYEEKIMLESSGIDTSVTQKQKRINKIAERLGVKIAWDIDGDPSEVGNGYYENGVIHMNKRAKALATVFAHEYIHH